MSDRTPAPEPVTIGLAAHHQFCPRRAWLEVAGEQTDTSQMAVGVAEHARTDDPSTARSGQWRAVDVAHSTWGYTGRCDTVETLPDGSLGVVEYKATPVRRRAEVTEAMVMQLALQVAALEDMGHHVSEQAVYFTQHLQQVPVEFTADFTANLEGVALTERGRKALIGAYERRVTGEFTHPTFGYRVTWRRAMEIQARLILGVLDGSQPRYLGIRVR